MVVAEEGGCKKEGKGVIVTITHSRVVVGTK